MQERVAALESAMQQMQQMQEELLVVVGLAPQTGHAQLTLDQRVAALEAKLQFVTTSGTSIITEMAALLGQSAAVSI